MAFPTIFVKVLVPLLIIIGGIVVSSILKETGPEAKKETPKVVFTTVEVLEAEPSDYTVQIKSRGTLKAAQQSRLSAEVGGTVNEVSERFDVGEVFQKGDVILQLESSDYETALAEARSRASEADVAFLSEQSRASQAARDWKKLGGNRTPDPLVLREPQLAAAKARAEAAAESVKKAQRDLERTMILAPYDCRVVAKNVDLGSFVTPGMMLAEIESAATFEVRLPISLDDYTYLKKDGAELAKTSFKLSAEAFSTEAVWAGETLKSEGLIDSRTRSINAVVQVSGMSQSGQHVPMSGLFVEAVIQGSTIENVVVVPRESFVNRSRILLLTDESKIEFRDVDVSRYEESVALITGGLEAGDRIITTSLDSPVAGQRVEAAQKEDKQ